ncbi:MAG: hypothetical protein E7592_06715 [Ruminococcaceae bacterium]|nr:hypothetical protein [Oscillospiraceae bacterium]
MTIFKKLLNKTIIALLAFATLLFCSCDESYTDYFKYCREDFCARVFGVADGINVDALVRYSPSDNSADNKTPVMTVRFSAPDTLKGIVATLYSDGRSAVRLGDLTFDSSALYGMLVPFLSLCPSENFSSINIKGNKSAEVVFLDDEREFVYSFNSDGMLCGFRGSVEKRSFDLKVTFREQPQ